MHELKVPKPKPGPVSPQPEVPSTLGQIECLTGLRFIAALLVFIHHFDGRFGFTGTTLPLANSAVSFFFVLSGFILTFVYGDRLAGRHQHDRPAKKPAAEVFSFLIKRFARLWPLHFVCILICVATVRYLNLDFGVVVANLFLVHSWIPHPSYVFALNNVSWSISTELFFCFAFPLLVMGGYRRFLWRYGYLILGTLGCLILLDFAIDFKWIDRPALNLIVQANPLMRLFEFATGILTAYFYSRASERVDRGRLTDTAAELGVVALVFAWWILIIRFNILDRVYFTPMIGHSLGLWIWFCSSAPLFGLMIWTFARSNGLISNWMASPVMVHLGQISFAFYMIHMLIMRVIDAEGDPFQITGLLGIVLSLVASLAAAELLFQFVEMPCKDGMSALLNGRPKDAIAKSITTIGKVLFKPLTAIAALALIAVAGFVHQNSLTKYEQTRISQIVQDSSEAHKQIDFVNSSSLQGSLLNVDDDSIKVELAWKGTRRKSHRRRTIYLMDQDMKPLHTEKLVWYRHHWSSTAGVMHDLVELDRTKFPDMHRIWLAWEDEEGKRALLSKNSQATPLEFLELHCVDPEVAALDTFALPLGKLRSVIEQMPQEKPPLRMGSHAILYGYECSPTPDGGLTINLAWKLKPELAARRVINFLDKETAVVGNYGDIAMLEFVREMTGPEAFFLDQMSIPPEKIKGASTITVGLWDEEAQQMVTIEKGETLANGQRLIIGRIETADQ